MPPRSTTPPAQPLALIAAALLYMVVAGTAATTQHSQGLSQLLSPASGLALALLLMGGPRMAASVLIGSLLTQAASAMPPDRAIIEALAATTAATLGAFLLRKQPDFKTQCATFTGWRMLFALGCCVGGGAGALVGSTGLLLIGQIGVTDWAPHALRWWMGDALGIVLVTPLILSWRHKLQRSTTQQRIPEGVLAYTLTFLAGQAIFSSWHNELLAPVANAYWMFLFITWVGVRLGMFGTVGLLCMIALQALWGTSQRTGFFARDLDGSQGFGYWSYMMILTLVGMSLATYMAERRRQRAALRVAAIAFECQEGILVTDVRSVIVQANLAFLRISGYTRYEVLGQTPHFLLAPPEAAPDAAPSASPDFAPPHNQQRREWHRRKSGEIYPVWITLSPVRDHHERITHYVLTLTDITDLRQQEEQRRQMEQAHRDALVQEVHHRIKNNLQGIMGMLRTLDQKHPRLHGPINQVISQVHSIAAIHGLQGSTTADRVRLSDLVCAIAGGIESLWGTPIHVDTPHWWQACYIIPSEAVPVALVLNELIVNAVKHGGKAQQDVRVRLHDGLQAGSVQITISNPGRWPPTAAESPGGLGLVAALMPRHGAQLTRAQRGDWAVLHLELAPPIIHIEPSDDPHHA
ncbi:MAG: histidine kinase [Verminephrobacter sp.]|nr:histidine kinase [Verminephrobacter sp.]